MHACLNVDEILRLIVSELVGLEAKAAAAALACCCKSFEDPVLDTLWETQNRLLPLLKSLPVDVWNEGGCTVSAPAAPVFYRLNYLVLKSFKRPPTALEWDRFREYTRRMRGLEEYGDLIVLPPEVYSALQLCSTANEPLFPQLETLGLSCVTPEFVPFTPLFLSPKTTAISIKLVTHDFAEPTIVASVITTFPTLCPNLRNISLRPLSRDPMITSAVSSMLLASNQNVLRCFDVDSPLTKEAREVICKLPDLHNLSVVIGEDTSIPLVVLPNLTNLTVEYAYDSRWLGAFHGATLGKLKAVTFRSGSEQNGDLLEAFEKVVLAASSQNTLSEFNLHIPRLRNPKYCSLLTFTQLTNLVIEFSCDDGCSSSVDDDVIMNLARTMPKLKDIFLGSAPCEIPTGVTAKGLVALAHHCSDLTTLRIHFQVASLTAPPDIGGTIPNVESTALRRDCGLKRLMVGKIPVPEESVLIVALTLARIFPHIEYIDHVDENWEKVMCAICLSRRITDYSGKEQPSPHLEVTLVTLPQESQLRIVGW